MRGGPSSSTKRFFFLQYTHKNLALAPPITGQNWECLVVCAMIHYNCIYPILLYSWMISSFAIPVGCFQTRLTIMSYTEIVLDQKRVATCGEGGTGVDSKVGPWQLLPCESRSYFDTSSIPLAVHLVLHFDMIGPGLPL